MSIFLFDANLLKFLKQNYWKLACYYNIGIFNQIHLFFKKSYFRSTEPNHLRCGHIVHFMLIGRLRWPISVLPASILILFGSVQSAQQQCHWCWTIHPKCTHLTAGYWLVQFLSLLIGWFSVLSLWLATQYFFLAGYWLDCAWLLLNVRNFLDISWCSFCRFLIGYS